MTKSTQHFEQKIDEKYYKNLIQVCDLIDRYNKEELGVPSTEEELFRQIQEEEREDWSNK